MVRGAVETSRPLIEQMGHELTMILPKESVFVDADLTRLAPGDERQAFLDAAAPGKVEDLCARAKACVAAVARMLPPAEESDAPYVDPFTSSLACEDARREAASAVKQPPPACRCYPPTHR